MSALDGIGAAITGTFDTFDAAAGIADWIAGLVKEAELRVELHASNELAQTKAHFYDREQDYLNRLADAKSMVYEASRICQQVLAEL